MINVIREYYQKAGMPATIVNNKVSSFERNLDIAKEFEHWIQTQEYLVENCVVVEGYTAEKISKLSEFVDGEGAFSLLIQLRENPKKALRRIKEGFVMK